MKKFRQKRENARKARKAVNLLFPGEKWIAVEDGIYLSPNRAIGDKTSYKDELRCAQILRNLGSTIYLAPENRRLAGKKFDAIVDGLKYEFKNVSGNASTLEKQFLRSRSQAPNVFINLENSMLSKKEIISTLYGARNKPETEKRHGYTHYNKFKDGKIVLNIREQHSLVYINVNDFEIKKA